MKELDKNELMEVDGGWIWFAAEAIVGGMLYDVYKAGSCAMMKARLATPRVL